MTEGKIAIVGLGLIGGSIARALAARGWQVVGCDADPATRLAASRELSVAATVPTDADLACVAVPLPQVAGVFADLADYRGLVTDVTSVKGPVRALAAGRPWRFVGSHPMAGTEHSGWAATDPALFQDAAWVICQEDDTDLDDWLRVAGLVTTLGARVVPTDARRHDDAVARISHYPHLAAASVAALAGDPLTRTLAAGSFRDGSRVAATAPSLTAAMCAGNAQALVPVLDEALADLAKARQALEAPDLGERISRVQKWLERGHGLRSVWPDEVGPEREVAATSDNLRELTERGGWVRRVSVDRATLWVQDPAPRASDH